MAKQMQAIRGMNDLLPKDMPYWHSAETIVRRLTAAYGYQELRLPILESTNLFQRTIGDDTDIVEKEMYTFADRNGDSLSLRPEATAGCVRACIEHGMLHNQSHRLWYLGPMFRYERPQQGRYRQFNQFGLEAIGFHGPDIDAELIQFSASLWQQLGIGDKLELVINSLGTTACRAAYRQQLVAYFTQHEAALDEDSKRRLQSNPLRILDSKNPAMRSILAQAPKLDASLDEASQQHFAQLCRYLDRLQIPYRVDPHLVRGLDYYTHTVFEWQTNLLGAQNAVCAGGRYDGLSAKLGGKQTPAIGFAIGMERLIALLSEQSQLLADAAPHVYLLVTSSKAQEEAFVIAAKLRQQLCQLRAITHCGGGSLKSQFKRADKSGAKIAVILGDDELAQEIVTIKWLREDRPQQCVAQTELASYLGTALAVSE